MPCTITPILLSTICVISGFIDLDLPPIRKLHMGPKLLCWVMTDVTLLTKTEAVRDTWTRRCDTTLFMSTQEDVGFPTIGLRDVSPGRDHIAIKGQQAWTYVYEHHFNDADYFLKADPDTYVFVDTLKRFLQVRINYMDAL